MVQAVIFGITGFFTCFLLEFLYSSVIKKKCRLREIDIGMGKLDIKTKSLIYILNTALWAMSGMLAEDIALALLIASTFSLAIMTSMIDLRIHIIPNEFVAALLIIGVAMQFIHLSLYNLMISVGCMLGVGTFLLIVGGLLGLQKIGAGDVKLAAAMGLVLGYPDILTAVLAMSVSILVFCFIGFARYRLSMKSMLPYAPFLMIGMVFGLIVGRIA